MTNPKETNQDKVARVVAEEVQIAEYDPSWPALFEAERDHLTSSMPEGMILRIEHFGSTSVADLAAKPIVDMVIEIRDVEEGKITIPRILEPQGYDCFWRPTLGDDIPPWYTWCIGARDGCWRRCLLLRTYQLFLRSSEARLLHSGFSC